MRRTLVGLLWALVAFSLSACHDREVTGPPLLGDGRHLNDDGDAAAAGRVRGVVVFSQNLYVGADVDLVIAALNSPAPDDDVPAILFAIQTLQNTAYPVRAAAIADEIARRRPHAVGLQEVSLINIDLTPLGAPLVIQLDFLAILQAELAARGLDYTVAATVQNTAAAVPGVTLVDFDALLIDAGRATITAAGGENFTAKLPPFPSGLQLERGFVWARVTIDGRAYAIVNTHAEADLAGNELDALRAAQVSELIAEFAADERVIMMGDFNDEPGSAMYQLLTTAGYRDVWPALRGRAPGLTCCHVADLSNHRPTLVKRIDYVFARGLGQGPRGRLFGAINRYGEVPADRVPGPAYRIWPSDHVGLIAALRN